jgi:propanediol dehydratase large subunit
MIGDEIAVLDELRKLAEAERLLDAPKARVQSGILDASLVLGNDGNASSPVNSAND